MIDYLNIQENNSAIADWVELYIVLNKISFSKGDLNSLLSQVDETCDENKSNSIFNYIKERIEDYGTNCPLKVEEERIIFKEDYSDYRIYLFCLILSVVDYEDLNSITEKPQKIFEKLSCELIKEYIHTEEGMVIGHPNGNFKESIDLFIEKTKRRKIGDNYYLKDKNDAGVDSLIWKSLDNRGNQIVIFNQATISKDYTNKQDILIEMWQTFFDFSNKEIIVTLSNPRFIDDLRSLNENSKRYGLIFDRGKIVRGIIQDEEILKEIETYCKNISEKFLTIN
jgi:hypothetical protein